MPVIFFDLGQTLAEPRFSEQGRLQSLHVFPFVEPLLTGLKAGARLGLISNTGNEKKAAQQEDLPALFNRTVSILKSMHDGNPS
jgi:hypothetical protein